MNKKVILGLVVLGLSLPAWAVAELAPYLGADAKWNKMEFNHGRGDNATKKYYPQGNVFGGVVFNEWFGFEIGYEITSQKKRANTIAIGDNFFGVINNTVSPASTHTKTKISGYHFNLVGYYPIMEEYCVSLFGSIGLAQLKLKSHLDVSFIPDPTVVGLNFVKRKLIPRATIGLQHMLTDNIGIRGMLTWEKTSAFKKVYPQGSTLFMSPKDSKSIGLGVFYSFK